MGTKRKARKTRGLLSVADAGRYTPGEIPLDKQIAESKREKEVKERKEADAKKAKTAIERGAAHLEDYARLLEQSGYEAMANEVRIVANDLAHPICLLGFPVAYQFHYKGGDGDNELKWVRSS
jgi:hypothetical protein